MQQKSIFEHGEGDQWFERNRAAVHEPKADDAVIKALATLSVRPSAILEIGSSTGYRVQTLVEQYRAFGAGIDPSAKAIEEGKRLFPKLDLRVGAADRLPFDSNNFDLVIFGFCFYLIDPDLHFSAVAEANRVLKNSGLLVIFDFIEPIPYANPYKHKEGCKSYKMEFSKYFMASPGYTLISRSMVSSYDRDQRICVDVLLKDMVSCWENKEK